MNSSSCAFCAQGLWGLLLPSEIIYERLYGKASKIFDFNARKNKLAFGWFVCPILCHN